MSDKDFQDSVLTRLDDILEFLTNPDAIEEDYVSVLKKREQEIDELKQEIALLETRLADRGSEIKGLEDELNDLADELKAEKKKNNSSNNSSTPTPKQNNSDEKKINQDTNLLIPEKLLENTEFSLSKLQEETGSKEKIKNEFQVFIFKICFDAFDDDNEMASSFLDIGAIKVNPKNKEKAYKEWRSKMDMGSLLLDLADELEKIPQQNRFKNLMEAFEKLL